MFLQECGLVAWEAAVDPLVSADVLLGNDLLNNLKRAAVEKKNVQTLKERLQQKNITVTFVLSNVI